ncbi:MAG TPA: HEAT repeat domain-containing protein, partial [Phycisphaerae bacterium]|nr:HEAT repeat domain-containing protein [Phycisphaerae bacterium]
MRLTGALALSLLVLMAAVSCTSTRDTTGPTDRGFLEGLEDVGATLEVWVTVIDALIPSMGHEDPLKREDAQRIFETICLNAARPDAKKQPRRPSDAETRRLTLCMTIGFRLAEPKTPEPARVWMLRQLERIGRGEVVAMVASLLNDARPRIRECARRCLEHNPDPAAGEALRNTLARTVSPEWRVALINSLGARGEQASINMLSEMVADEDPAVAAAAIAALGDIGGIPAVETLAAARSSAPAELRAAVTNAYLRCAQRLPDEGATERAAKVFDELYVPTESRRIRIAALSGLVCTRPEQSLPLLLDLITGDDESMRVVAARLAEEIPGESATRVLVDKLAAAPPAA